MVKGPGNRWSLRLCPCYHLGSSHQKPRQSLDLVALGLFVCSFSSGWGLMVKGPGNRWTLRLCRCSLLGPSHQKPRQSLDLVALGLFVRCSSCCWSPLMVGEPLAKFRKFSKFTQRSRSLERPYRQGRQKKTQRAVNGQRSKMKENFQHFFLFFSVDR